VDPTGTANRIRRVLQTAHIPGNVLRSEVCIMSKRITKSQWSIAAVALVLGNLANILESVKKLSGDGYAMIVFFWHGSRAIPIGFAVVGYALLGVLAFRVDPRLQPSKPLAMYSVGSSVRPMPASCAASIRASDIAAASAYGAPPCW